MEQIDVAIIGSGPSGWSAAIYLARAGLVPVVFAGESSGGQLMLTTEVENFPGFPKGIMGPDLMIGMREQAARFGAIIHDVNVTAVDFSNRPFTISTATAQYQAQAVLIATGAKTVWLGVPGEEALIGRGVSSCAVCDAAFFKDKVTYVVGGGDAAMEDILALTKFAKSVTVIHRRDSFRASKIMQDRVLQHPKVSVRWNSVVTQVQGTTKLESITVSNAETGATEELAADGLFVAIGHTPATTIFANQVMLDTKGFVVTRLALATQSLALAQEAVEPETGFVAYPTMTSVEGVFAAGDVVDFRYKQAITAAGFGVMASLDIEKWLAQQAL